MIRGEAVTHARIIDTLNRGLELRDDGEVIVKVGSQWAYVEAEDTVFVVRNIRPVGGGDAENPDGIELILNNPDQFALQRQGCLYPIGPMP